MNHAETAAPSRFPGNGSFLLIVLLSDKRVGMLGAIDAFDQDSVPGDLFETEVTSVKQRSRSDDIIDFSDLFLRLSF